ncbi:MAG: hypothetical protein K2O00_01225 [Muribaculaceae bacterium]|nr:hypothetical protein [Muribaculaceae bacterium]
MDELNEMRLQMAAMKQSLDKSQIISKKLLAKVMGSKASLLNKIVIGEVVLLPVIFLIILGICYACKSTLWVAWVFLIIGGADTILDFWTIRIGPKKLNSYSMLELKKFIVKQKKVRRLQAVIAVVVMIPWLLWTYYEWCHLNIFFTTLDETLRWTILFIVGISVVVAIVVVILIMKKLDSINDDMVADIDEFTE